MLPNDRELFDFVRQNLHVAAVCDILDTLGYRNQAMHHRLRPLLPDIRNCGFVGRARVMAYDLPVRCGDVLVNPHELVFADFDGIVVIPKAVEATVMQLALDKVGKESQARSELQSGKTLREVYDKYGIL